MFNIKCMGAAKVVTGSCHLVETDNSSFLIDCGMFQGSKDLTRKNYEDFLFNAQEIDFLILTHAHIDHSGLIPKLVKNGFKGNIYCSSATADLLPVMLEDSAHIQEMDTMHENRRREREGLPPREPLYSKEDAENAGKLIISTNYNTEVRISDNISFILRDAGHIIGSSMAEIFLNTDGKTRKIVFSGDIGQWDVPIICDPYQIESCDYLFVESTYGDRLHKERADNSREDILLDIIKKTTDRGGKTIIPSFAIERTQEILYSINEMIQKGLFPDIKVFVDSPLAIRATEVFRKHTEVYDEEARALNTNPFNFRNLVFTLSAEESKAINEEKDPCVIIAGSGMCTAGRIRHHLKHNLWKKENSVVFVGYQAEGTLGRYILEKAETVKMMGMKIKVKAEIHKINSFSAHADYSEIISWAEKISIKPEKIFIVHGEEKSALSLEEKLEKKGFDCYIPSIGEKLF